MKVNVVDRNIDSKIIVNNRLCKVCKNPFYLERNQIDNNSCYTCQFWVDNLMVDSKNEDWAIINGEHYRFGEHLSGLIIDPSATIEEIAKAFDSKLSNKGMGGAKCIITYNDGRMVITDDLWHQGEIPEVFKSIPAFADNAELVSVA